MMKRWKAWLAKRRAAAKAKKTVVTKPAVKKPAKPAPAVEKPNQKELAFTKGRKRYTPWAWRSYARRYPESPVSRLQLIGIARGKSRDLSVLFTRLKEGFTAKRDRRERWDTHLPAFLAKQTWYDDCDGFVCTSIDAVCHFSYAHPSEIAFHLINSGLNPKIRKTRATHGVATVRVGGVTWVFDNLQDKLVKFEDCPDRYTWLRHMTLDKPGYWYSTILG